jgi:hypothetical protein
MAYVADNLALLFNPIGGALKRIWLYQTASDADATIVGAGYFANGYTAGLRAGDVVFAVASTGPKWKIYQVTTEGTAASPATTVSAPTAIT